MTYGLLIRMSAPTELQSGVIPLYAYKTSLADMFQLKFKEEAENLALLVAQTVKNLPAV